MAESVHTIGDDHWFKVGDRVVCLSRNEEAVKFWGAVYREAQFPQVGATYKVRRVRDDLAKDGGQIILLEGVDNSAVPGKGAEPGFNANFFARALGQGNR